MILPPPVLHLDSLSLPSVFVLPVTFYGSLRLNCQLHLLLPSVLVLPFLICQLACVLPVCSFFSAILVFTAPGSKFKVHSCPWCLHLCATRFIHCCHQPFHSRYHSSLLAVFAPLFICCCLSICAAIFIYSKPITFVDAHVFSLPVSVMDALRIRTASFGSLLPTVFYAASLNSLHCQLHLLPALNLWIALGIALPLFFVTALSSFLWPVSYVTALGPIFIHFCPWSFVPPVLLTAALASCTCYGLSISIGRFLMFTFGCAYGSLHIFNFCLFACKHSCCAITLIAGGGGF